MNLHLLQTLDSEDSTMKELASEALQWFERKTREGKDKHNPDEYWRCKEGCPDWIVDLAYQAHQTAWPSDWIYDVVVQCLCELASGIDVEDIVMEADIYTKELLCWLANERDAMDYCDEACEDGQVPDSASLIDRIMLGNYYHKRAILDIVRSCLEEQTSERETSE